MLGKKDYYYYRYTKCELWDKIINLDSSFTYKKLGRLSKHKLIDIYFELRKEEKNEYK